ncbi:hypothetical protein BJV82DRAFT_637195 [Fennellomyces sp. T-0311]|nr:hypothetical protein BJV82DRAFT_637195 [Fennellomyces sp. T-0311]
MVQSLLIKINIAISFYASGNVVSVTACITKNNAITVYFYQKCYHRNIILPFNASLKSPGLQKLDWVSIIDKEYGSDMAIAYELRLGNVKEKCICPLYSPFGLEHKMHK